MNARGRAQDLDLVPLVRIADADVEEEPVELRLGKRVRPLLLDRVLRREHEERLREPHRAARRRHPMLLHRLEERGRG